MKRRSYAKPPIVEALVELRFVHDVSGDALMDTLSARLADSYSGERKQQELVTFSAAVDAHSVAASARRAPHITFLQSDDGLRLIGCRTQTISVHTLAPYPGWESFFAQVEEAVEALPGDLRAGGLSTISVRYIDRITLPVGDGSYLDFLTIMPTRPEPLPSVLSGFHFVTQANDPDDGTQALLTLASGPPTPTGEPVLVYDLLLQRTGEPLCSFDGREWQSIVEELHERQRGIFEASITDRTRELFE
ncbi:TIGR04255 family protein [Haliangium sp.]|uniref:TIGR04255 family protein n=1 Tax=Haliangium sp. TaxID=2663208 RepID=UPI003D130A76